MLPVLRRNGSWTTPIMARPFGRFDSLLDRVFEDMGQVVSKAGGPALTWGGLPIAMWEDDDKVYLEVEVPGLKQDELELTVHEGVLTIRGERKVPEGRTYLYNGRAYGTFERVVSLPETIDTNEVQAQLADGVLHLTLNKIPASKPKKIEIQNS